MAKPAPPAGGESWELMLGLGGKTARLKLNGKGRAQLKQKGKLAATLTVVAADAAGEKQTKTARVTIKPHLEHD